MLTELTSKLIEVINVLSMEQELQQFVLDPLLMAKLFELIAAGRLEEAGLILNGIEYLIVITEAYVSDAEREYLWTVINVYRQYVNTLTKVAIEEALTIKLSNVFVEYALSDHAGPNDYDPMAGV